MAQHVAIPKTAGKVAFTWSEPDVSLLEDRRGELPTFPIDVFPPNMAKWLVRAARGAGTDIDHVALPLIGASSALIGKARRIQATPSWIEPMALWACIIGESGSRKTPGLRTVTRTMDRIEKDNRPSAYQRGPEASGTR
jgi:hypothetical protein